MKPFRFRAALVLDLRRRQHETAQAQLAQAQRERDTADLLLHVAEAACARAERNYCRQLEAGSDADGLRRHRNWIAFQHAEADDRRRVLEQRHLAVERAAAEVRRTHRQVRMLERLRDRAWRRYEDEARHRENVEIDLLANIQFATRMRGGINCDD